MTVKYKDWTNRKFGRLTVVRLHHKVQKFKPDGSPNGHRYYWECKCSCGNTTIVLVDHLTRHKILSCGCLGRERASLASSKHHMRHTRIYGIWSGMRQRCRNKNSEKYSIYGGRGIIVCKEWDEDFLNFYNWAINNGYQNDLTIDRIDVNGNYEPANCRWATPKEQARNARTNVNLTFNGETHCIAEWSEITGIKMATISYRIKHGWTVEETLTIPVGTARFLRH